MKKLLLLVFVLMFSHNLFPQVTLLSPNGGEIWLAGSTQNVSWTDMNASTGYVNLDYSTDNGGTWNRFANSASSMYPTYSWWLPTLVGTTYKVRVTDANNSIYFDESDAPFTITDKLPSTLTLTYPNGGENWQVGSTQYLAWTNTNMTGNVNIDYSTDNGTTWFSVAADLPSMYPTFMWTVPNTPSTSCIIKVYDASDASVFDESDAVFTIQRLEQFTEQTSISLLGLGLSSVAWGDYNNDGYLDILLTGRNDASHPYSIIYKNNGDGTFTEQTNAALTAASSGSAAWGDYDNNGYLDILLTGYTLSGPVSQIYKNNGDGTFTLLTSVSLPGVGNSSVAWGDYDNDGKLDVLLTGNSFGARISKIYKNNGNGIFTEQTSVSLKGVSNSSVAWGDYDNDGYLDILLTGLSDVSGQVSIIYRNNGDGTFTEQTSVFLAGVEQGSVAWGDYDNDGYLDILLTGINGTNQISKIYKNTGAGTFTEQTSASLTGVSNSSVAWGDYNNDGLLDILLTGLEMNNNPISKIYKNMGEGIFYEQTSASLIGVGNSSAVWGDYDNDGALDILLTGYAIDNGYVSKIYKNINALSNTVSTAPTNLTSSVSGNDVYFNWNKSFDQETPQNGLSYNLLIGTTLESVDVLSPMANKSNGFRRIVKLGNNQTNSWTIKNLPGGTYLWSVQAIDAAFTGSPFASQEVFTVGEITNTLLLLSPNGGENLVTGTVDTIHWSANYLTQVKLDYTTDYGATWINIVGSMPAEYPSGYAWVVPNTPSTMCKVRVTDINDPTMTDECDRVFTIIDTTKNIITISSPNGGENFQVGTNQYIAWTNTNMTGTVNIDYSTDNGTNWIAVATNLPSMYPTYMWMIPNTPSAKCKIKISNTIDSLIYDLSDNVFFIQPNSLEWAYQDSKVESVLISNYFLTESVGFAVGTVGCILKTTDGGVVWNKLNSGTTTTLRGVYFTSESTGYIIGEGGLIMKTTDTGNNWFLQTSGVTQHLRSVCFISGSMGWASGDQGTVLRTIDGGNTWVKITTQVPQAFYNINFVNNNIGFAAGDGGMMLKTTDGGLSWYQQTTNVDSNLYSTYFINENVGWVVGKNGQIIKTTDGGNSWGIQNSGTTLPLRGVYMESLSAGWIVGYGGIILRTENGGSNWIPQQIGINESLTSVFFTDNYNGWAVGFSGTILRYKSNQPTLTLISPNGGEYFVSGTVDTIRWSAPSATQVKIDYTTDNGATWMNIAGGIYSIYPVYAWTIPYTPSTTCKVRVTNNSNPNVFDESDSAFTIQLFKSGEYTPDANTVLLDHFNATTDAAVLAFRETGLPCGSEWPSAAPNFSFIPGMNELYYALNMAPPISEPQGSTTYLKYPGGQVLSQANGTIEFWTYLPSYEKGLSLVEQGPFFKSCAGWTFNMFIDSTGTLQSSAWAAFGMNSGTNKVPLNKWTHLAVSWGSMGAKMYIDGMLVGSDANTGMPADGYSGSLLITLGTGAGVSVLIDELRVSNIQRTEFNIIPQEFVSVASPNGGENLVAGEVDTIRWTSSNASILNIEYSTDNGMNWISIYPAMPASVGSAPWLVPNTPSTSCKVRITDADNATIFDESDNVFTILQPYFSQTWDMSAQYSADNNPNGTWTYGRKWDPNDINFDIFTTKGDNGMWWFGNWGHGGPSIQQGPNMWAKDNSNGLPTLRWICPNTGIFFIEGFFMGADNRGVDVDFFITKNGTTIFSGEVKAYNEKTNYSIPICSMIQGDKIDFIIKWAGGVYSEYSWTIVNGVIKKYGENELILIKPNGGENWQINSSQNITWTSSGVTNIKLEYTTDGGINWITIIENTTANSGNYIWTVSNTPSINCKVRITDNNNAAIYDESDGVFTIAENSLQNGLVAYYPFNGNTNDESGNGYNGTNNGATLSTDRFGNPDKALSFDGINDYVKYGAVLPDMDKLTISVWILANSGGTIICDGDWQLSNDFVLANSPNSIGVTATKNGFNLANWIYATNSLYNTWNHIVWTMTGEESKIYLNDILINTIIVGGSNVGYHDFILATQEFPQGSYGWQGYWQGEMDDLRIYNHVLTQAEIDSLYYEGGYNTLNYGGKIYHTVKIGAQTWLKENLDIGTMVSGTQDQTNNSSIEKYCYDDLPANCDTYGGLYQWNEAMAYKTTPSTQGICPIGWHIPTKSEYDTLAAFVNYDANALKEIGQGADIGAGTNTSGFSALLGGFRFANASFSSIRSNIHIWSSTQNDALNAADIGLSSNGGSTIFRNSLEKEYGLSIRCLKDEDNTASIQISSPNGGEVFQANSPVPIEWIATNVYNFSLEFTSDNGSSWSLICDTLTNASTGFLWYTPYIESEMARVRISDKNNPTLFDESDSNFTVTNKITQFIPLYYSGWNMISFYVQPVSSLPRDVFPTPPVLQVKTELQSFDPALPEFLNTLKSVNASQGYLVKTDSAERSFQVKGDHFYPADGINYRAGWNLMSYYYSYGESVWYAFEPIMTSVEEIKTLTSYYNPLGSPETNTLYTLEPGEAYWLRLKNNIDGYVLPSPQAIMPKKHQTIGQKLMVDLPWKLKGYTQSTVAIFTVTSNGEPVNAGSVVAAFVNNECRAISEVKLNSEGTAFATLVINGDKEEEVSFKIFDAEKKEAFGSNLKIKTKPGTTIPGIQELPFTFVTGVEDPILPTTTTLMNAYPNPFNPETRIRYELNKDQHVSLKIYDVLGKEVITLVDDTKNAGYYEVSFDASGLPSGIYFYRMQSGEYVSVKKLLLLK